MPASRNAAEQPSGLKRSCCGRGLVSKWACTWQVCTFTQRWSHSLQVQAFDSKTARGTAAELTAEGAKLYDLLQSESVHAESRAKVVSRPQELSQVRILWRVSYPVHNINHPILGSATSLTPLLGWLHKKDLDYLHHKRCFWCCLLLLLYGFSDAAFPKNSESQAYLHENIHV